MGIEKLEPLATDVFHDGVRDNDENNCASLRSIAISLNRIADALYEYKVGPSITNVLANK